MIWRANHAFLDHLLRQRHGGHTAVIEADHVQNAGFLHGLDHLLTLGYVHGHRLLAEDVLAVLRGRQANLFVRVVAGGDVHQVNIVSSDDAPVAAAPALPSVLVRELLRLSFNQAAYFLHDRFGLHIGKSKRAVSIADAVRFAHKLVAHKSHVHLFLSHVNSSFSCCRRRLQIGQKGSYM